jgi:Tol biopolymer transport system component
LDGSPVKELFDRQGTWSPDGLTMAVIRGSLDFGDPIEVWLSDGARDERMLVRLADAGSLLYWSPDGSRIAVASAPFLTPNIYVIDVDTGRVNTSSHERRQLRHDVRRLVSG